VNADCSYFSAVWELIHLDLFVAFPWLSVVRRLRRAERSIPGFRQFISKSSVAKYTETVVCLDWFSFDLGVVSVCR
jgi:hypothetical protein